MLRLAEQHKTKIAAAQLRTNHTLDSLCKWYNVSNTFRERAICHFGSRYDIGLLTLYRRYRDTLRAHSLYDKKIVKLLQVINKVRNYSPLNEFEQEDVSDLYAVLFPGRGIQNTDSGSFGGNFKRVANNFSGMARGYLLSRLMYQADTKGLRIPKPY